MKNIIVTLREDYAGFDECWSEYDSRYYITTCGTAHRNNKLDDILFLQTASQMLATTGDRGLRLALRASEEYQPWVPGFYARRCGDELIVTQVNEETRLRPGDVITKINSTSPGTHRERIQKNFFYSDEPEREIWHGLLKMADHIMVRHMDASEEDIRLIRYPSSERVSQPELRVLRDGVVYLKPDWFDGSGELYTLIEESSAQLGSCNKLIIDLRTCGGNEETDYLPLLPYVFRGKHIMADLFPPELLLTNYSELNCFRKLYYMQRIFEQTGDAEIEPYINELNSLSGKGWIEEAAVQWEDIPAELTGKAPQQVVVITDTWCENAAESFVEAAKRSEAVTVIGRPTMGTLDYCGMIAVALDDDFTLTYAMSKRKAAADESGIKGRGLPVDVYIPFSAEECARDLLLEKALSI